MWRLLPQIERCAHRVFEIFATPGVGGRPCRLRIRTTHAPVYKERRQLRLRRCFPPACPPSAPAQHRRERVACPRPEAHTWSRSSRGRCQSRRNDVGDRPRWGAVEASARRACRVLPTDIRIIASTAATPRIARKPREHGLIDVSDKPLRRPQRQVIFETSQAAYRDLHSTAGSSGRVCGRAAAIRIASISSAHVPSFTASLPSF